MSDELGEPVRLLALDSAREAAALVQLFRKAGIAATLDIVPPPHPSHGTHQCWIVVPESQRARTEELLDLSTHRPIGPDDPADVEREVLEELEAREARQPVVPEPRWTPLRLLVVLGLIGLVVVAIGSALSGCFVGGTVTWPTGGR